MFCGGAMDRLTDNGAAAIFAGGAGTAAISIRQPMQQLSTQCLLLVWSAGEGVSSPTTTVWQMMMPSGALAASAAALAEAKLAIRLDSAIA